MLFVLQNVRRFCDHRYAVTEAAANERNTLTPSQPKEADIRQGIPAERHGHRPVAVAEKARRREDVEAGAGE
jgi:hypothetical protein